MTVGVGVAAAILYRGNSESICLEFPCQPAEEIRFISIFAKRLDSKDGMPKYGELKVVPKPTWSIRSFLIVDVIPNEEAAKVFDWLESRRVDSTWFDLI